jgi:hypothetical protein
MHVTGTKCKKGLYEESYEKYGKHEASMKDRGKQTWLKMISCLAYSSTLKMEGICSSEMLLDFQRATWRVLFLGNNRCENLKSYEVITRIKDDSKLLSVFPWPIVFKPETTTDYGI